MSEEIRVRTRGGSGWVGLPDNIEEWLGFIYLIVSPEGRMYVGKKQFWKAIRRKPKKGYARIRKDLVEHDWKRYWGSSKELLADFKRTGGQGWKRYVLKCCKSKWELAYEELREQMARDVLRSPAYYNGIVRIRLGAMKRGQVNEDK